MPQMWYDLFYMLTSSGYNPPLSESHNSRGVEPLVTAHTAHPLSIAKRNEFEFMFTHSLASAPSMTPPVCSSQSSP